jgi:S-formylglutathione hydrolase FrmB
MARQILLGLTLWGLAGTLAGAQAQPLVSSPTSPQATPTTPTAPTAEPSDEAPAKLGLRFAVEFSAEAQKEPFTGRVYVLVDRERRGEPRHYVTNWFDPPRMLALDVKDHAPGEPAMFEDVRLSYPGPLVKLEPGEYRVQAIARRSLDSCAPGTGEGDLYSYTRRLELDPTVKQTVMLTLDQVVPADVFPDADRVRYFEVTSKLLSDFHGREVKMRGAVVLPEGWDDDPQRRYPVLYTIPGFGGDHYMAHYFSRGRRDGSLANQVLLVVPDPNCYRGHCVFADSANNGPWGRAFVEEFIPTLERRFRGVGSPKHRYVTGLSSGGWSSLWLQITYPKVFNGCWSHAPDPVDFRAFMRVNIYAKDASAYRLPDGKRLSLTRSRWRGQLWADEFVWLEEVIGPGGQMHSFEAVFSPRGPDGEPMPVFDRKTGAVDPAVAKAWQAYDIRLVLEKNWPALRADLAGKLHLYCGDEDTFYLDEAFLLLRDSLKELGSDAEIMMVPGMRHTMYRGAIKPMYETILKNFREDSDAARVPSS